MSTARLRRFARTPRLRRFTRTLYILAAVAAALLLIGRARAAAPEAQDRIQYQREQAVAGRVIYTDKCASCHGASLDGALGPALRGEAFQKKWLNGQRKFLDLYTLIQQSMPMGAPGSLTGEDYIMVQLYLLSQNGYTPSGQELSAADVRKTLATPENATPVALDEAAEPTTPFPQAPIGSGTAATTKPDDAELAHPGDSSWLLYNGDFSGARYSGLSQINTGNAAALAPVCIFQPSEIGAFQTSPLIYDGLMYFTTPYNTYAIDAANCAKRWEHRYPVGKTAPWTVNRGAAIYRGKIFRGTPNGHLIALDAKSGKLLWDVWMVSNAKGYWLSAAPVAYQGLVYMGTAGADSGANGFIEAFDAETGKLRWKFNVIPTGNEVGAKTWGKGAQTGGGSFWSSFAIDAANGQLLAPVGNPAPDFREDLRPGDNLFTNSVVALDLQTGKLKWWVQQVPHDTHDWDTAAAPSIYEQDGHSYMAVANKGGWLYLYDRHSHKLIAQPEISPHLNADVPLNKEGVHHCPGTVGGAEWNGAAYSPATKALFVNSVHWCGTTQITEDKYIEGASYFDGVPALDPFSEARGFLHAFDASSGKPLWTRQFDSPMVAGVTPTAGNVLFTGSLDGSFLALDARDGSTLYSFNTGGAIAGELSTYQIAGRQYVAVPAGNNSRVVWHSGGAMMVVIFALH